MGDTGYWKILNKYEKYLSGIWPAKFTFEFETWGLEMKKGRYTCKNDVRFYKKLAPKLAGFNKI